MTHDTNSHATHGAPHTEATSNKKIRIRVRRQDSQEAQPYWQDFEIPYRVGHNVLSALMEIRKNPVDISGRPVEPVCWEANCLEQVCGACSMVINGRPRQGCTALVDQLEQPIVLEPMDKFPIIRDLAVDRTRMFDNLKKIKAWVSIDGSYDLGPAPRQNPDEVQTRYKMSECMTCGVCLQACPQFSADNNFVGAQIFNQVRLFNTHPTGAYQADERIDAVMGEGGIADCGNAQNCVEACPKTIPLTESIAYVGRKATVRAVKKWIGG